MSVETATAFEGVAADQRPRLRRGPPAKVARHRHGGGVGARLGRQSGMQGMHVGFVQATGVEVGNGLV